MHLRKLPEHGVMLGMPSLILSGARSSRWRWRDGRARRIGPAVPPVHRRCRTRRDKFHDLPARRAGRSAVARRAALAGQSPAPDALVPIDAVARRIVVRYGRVEAARFTLDATVKGQPQTVHGVEGNRATGDQRSGARKLNIDPTALLSCPTVSGPHEALALKLKTATPGKTFRLRHRS
jgi:hypothetical protein